MDLAKFIRDVPDFPKKGIIFKDITPLLKNPAALKTAIKLMADPFREEGVTDVVGIESRGFIFGAPLAVELSAGFIPIRKPGKLPCATTKEEYELEYGSDAIELHTDSLGYHSNVLLCDDLLATGGTMAAAVKLVRQTGAHVVGVCFVIELADLRGRNKLEDVNLFTLLKY